MKYFALIGAFLLGYCDFSNASSNALAHRHREYAHNFAKVARIKSRSKRAIHLITTTNEFCDLIIREIRPIMVQYHMEPFNAGDQSQTIALVSKLYLTNVLVSNLTTMKRYGNLTIIDDDQMHITTFSIRLTFDDLQMKANYKLSLTFLAVQGLVTAKLPGVLIAMTFKVDFKLLVIELVDFQLIKDDKNIQVHFSESLEAFVLNIISAPIVALFGNIMLNIAEGPIKKEINSVLDGINKGLKSGLTSLGNNTN